MVGKGFVQVCPPHNNELFVAQHVTVTFTLEAYEGLRESVANSVRSLRQAEPGAHVTITGVLLTLQPYYHHSCTDEPTAMFTTAEPTAASAPKAQALTRNEYPALYSSPTIV